MKLSLTKTLRWTARIIAILITAYALIMFIGSAIGDDSPVTVGLIVFLILLAPTTIAMFAAWKWEKIGGIITIIGSVAMWISVFIDAGQNKFPAATLMAGPFFLVGILYLTCWIRSKK